jgi:hypothetical protein
MTMTRLALCEASPYGGHYFGDLDGNGNPTYLPSGGKCAWCEKTTDEVSRVTICSRCYKEPEILFNLGPYAAAICGVCYLKEKK